MKYETLIHYSFMDFQFILKQLLNDEKEIENIVND